MLPIAMMSKILVNLCLMMMYSWDSEAHLIITSTPEFQPTASNISIPNSTTTTTPTPSSLGTASPIDSPPVESSTQHNEDSEEDTESSSLSSDDESVTEITSVTPYPLAGYDQKVATVEYKSRLAMLTPDPFSEFPSKGTTLANPNSVSCGASSGYYIRSLKHRE